MGVTPLTDTELALPAGTDTLTGRAPPWFYVLKERNSPAASVHLGPVGGRLVAEALRGLLAADPLSYLSVHPTWTPDLAENGTFGMPQLVSFAVDNAAA